MSTVVGMRAGGGPGPLTIRVGVHWAELDSFGHVNNSRYFTWFESARMALFERIGLPLVAGADHAPILARATCDFLRPVHWPADIEVRVTVPRLGNTSFTTAYEAVRVDLAEPETVAKGEGIVVLVDAEGRPLPLPPTLRQALAAHG